MANEPIKRLAVCLVLLSFAVEPGCAFKRRPPRSGIDLMAAQSLIARARELGAAKRAPNVLARAETLLEDATKERRADRKRWLESMAAAEAAHALSVTELMREIEGLSEEMAGVRLRQIDELEESRRENRRLEDRIDVLIRDLELTENEIIRIRARFKGLETRAEASSAIAEARILIRRASRERCSASALARCQELLARAEEQLRTGNYGAAAFFALKTQELLRSALRAAPSRSEHERSGPFRAPLSVTSTRCSCALPRSGDPRR